MRRIVVNAYKRQDGTAVRAHEKNIPHASPNLTKKASEIDLLGLIEGEYKPATRQLSSSEIISKFWDVGNENRSASDKLENVSEKAKIPIAGSVVAGIPAMGIVAAGSGAAALPFLGVVAVSLVAVSSIPWLVASVIKRLKKRKIKKELKGFLKSPVSKKEIQEKVAQNPTDLFPTSSKMRKKEIVETSYHEPGDHGRHRAPIIEAKVELRNNGTGVMTVPIDFYHGGHMFNETFDTVTEFYPEADLSKRSIEGRFEGENMNLQKANFFQTTFEGGVIWKNSDLRNINLSETKFKLNSNMEGSDLRDANLEKADLGMVSLTGADLRGANITDTKLPVSLEGIIFDDEQKNLISDSLHEHIYEKVSFQDAIEKLDVSEKQFEFLVLSQGIKVRDNQSSHIVTQNFDPMEQHVDLWEVERVKKTIQENPSILKV